MTTTDTTITKRITFNVPGRPPQTGVVKNGNATLGAVAARVASRMGLAGTFEMIDQRGEPLSPATRLADLPAESSEVTLASELTPAA